MTATWDDEKIARLMNGGGINGLASYGLWWRVLEIVATQMGPKTTDCSVTYDINRWSHLLSIRGSLVISSLSRLAVTTLVTTERHGSEVTVTIPNLLKYRDEYSRKSGHSPVQEGETEGEGDTEERKTPSESKETASPDGSAATARGTRISLEVLPEKWATWALTKGTLTVEESVREFDKFRDYFISKAGKDGRRASWEATWRNWCREYLRRRDRAPTLFEARPPPQSATERAIAEGHRRILKDGRL